MRLIDLMQRLRDEPEKWHSHRGEHGLVWAIRAPAWDTVAVIHETCEDMSRGSWRGYAVPYSSLATGAQAADGPWGVLMNKELGLILDLGPCARSAEACRRRLMRELRKHMVTVAGCVFDLLSARRMELPETLDADGRAR